MAKDFAPDADRLVYRLQRAFAAVESRKAELLADVDLLPSHYAVMMNVRARPGVIGAELARALGVTPQNVTGLVGRLTERGLVERRRDDRRPNLLELHLTDRGRKVLERADALVAGLEEQVVAGLGSERSSALKADLERLRTAAATGPGRPALT